MSPSVPSPAYDRAGLWALLAAGALAGVLRAVRAELARERGRRLARRRPARVGALAGAVLDGAGWGLAGAAVVLALAALLDALQL